MIIIQEQFEQVIKEAINSIGSEYLDNTPIFITLTLNDCCMYIYILQNKIFTILLIKKLKKKRIL